MDLARPAGFFHFWEAIIPSKAPTEIDVTPAMVRAGVKILVDQYDAIGGLVDEAVAADIFRAMLSESPGNIRLPEWIEWKCQANLPHKRA